MKRYSKSELETLKAQYGKVDTEELAATLGVTPDNLRKQASRLGLSQPWPDHVEPYRQGDDYVIPLCSRKHTGKVAYVDADQYHLVKDHRWHVVKVPTGVYYARTNIECKPRNMHGFLIDVPHGKMIDHIDGDGLNNRSSNLRPAKPHQNSANAHHDDRCKGVHKVGHRWVARIRSTYIGSFDTEIEAAIAYDKAALGLWGEFACLNYPDWQGNADGNASLALNRT